MGIAIVQKNLIQVNLTMFKKKPKTRHTHNRISYIAKNTVRKRRRQRIPRIKSGRKRPQFTLFIKTFVVITITVIGLYLLFFNKSFIIQNITVTETNDDNEIPSDILAATNAIKGLNLLFIDQDSIIEKILSVHPEIKTIDFKKVFPNSVSIIISYYQEVVNFTIVDTPSGIPHSFIVNEKGIIAKNNEKKPDLPQLILKNVDDQTLEAIIAEDQRFAIDRIKKATDAEKKFTETFTIPIIESHYYQIEREVRLLTDKGFFVWFDLSKDIDEQINKLRRALPELDIHTEPLQYIDLRISTRNGEKIIFKRKK